MLFFDEHPLYVGLACCGAGSPVRDGLRELLAGFLVQDGVGVLWGR